MIDFTQIILAGFVASIVWFLMGSVLYMNPRIKKIYDEYKGDRGMKQWKSMKMYMFSMYVFGTLVPAISAAFVYDYIAASLPMTFWPTVFVFGIFMFLIRIVPRYFDMWLQSSYPGRLLVIELINGTIWGFVVALIFAWML